MSSLVSVLFSKILFIIFLNLFILTSNNGRPLVVYVIIYSYILSLDISPLARFLINC